MATKFDAVFASELRDTQGEILDVKGADISELEAGRGVVNDNHSNKLPDVIGRITSAKKIFGIEDCENDRQKYYWNKIKAPYLYGEGVLFDDEDHRSARAAAAILRHQHRTDSPLKLKCSVEGGIVERGKKDERILARTKIRGLALTFTPANNATLVEGLDLAKSSSTVAEEMNLIKSLVPAAVVDVPALVDFSRKISMAKIRENVEKIHETVSALKKNSRFNQPLKKDAAENLKPLAGIPHGAHDVEVHPLVDHLKRVKGIIGDKPSMKVRDLSKLVTPDIMKHVPRDAKGNVTPQAIDDHIDSLPKYKVRAVVGPYTWGSQMHHPDAQEDVMSVHIHPDTWDKMDDRTKAHFNQIQGSQHNFEHGPNQIGWARIDQHSGPQDHMHIDEIQSDFVNHDKIKRKTDQNFNDDASVESMHDFLSHGHDDPQHLVHSVVNELGRRHGINSVSMDTPDDQAKQSNLQTHVRNRSRNIEDIESEIYESIVDHPGFIALHNQHYDTHLGPDAIESKRQNAPNPYLRSALKKIDDQTIDNIKKYLQDSAGDSEPSYGVQYYFPEINKLPDPEKDAFVDFLREMDQHRDRPEPFDYVEEFADPDLLAQLQAAEEQEFQQEAEQQAGEEQASSIAPPVHQIDTYNKRPKKLGFTNVSKESLMPDHSRPSQEVQYNKLYKMIKALSAGYGGAGSPTNLTGGGVLQTESVEGSRSFKYIDCPNCGKEQPYMKYQVKCRSCGKSLPFDTLAKFFLSNK